MKYKNKALVPGFNIEKSTKDQMKKYCEDHSITITEFLKKAINNLLKSK